MGFFSFIGIDPGLKGAIGVLDNSGGFVGLMDMPVKLWQGGRRVDGDGLAMILRAIGQGQALCAFEDVGYMKGDGAMSGASLARSGGVTAGVLAGLGIRAIEVLPAVWKRAMGLIGRGKAGSLARANELWPSLQGTLTHDQAEALLLARFAWLQRAQVDNSQSMADREPPDVNTRNTKRIRANVGTPQCPQAKKNEPKRALRTMKNKKNPRSAKIDRDAGVLVLPD